MDHHESDKNMMTRKDRATLIFDGTCPICTGAATWIEANADEGAFELMACQDEERSSRFPGIERAACMNAMHVVFPDGKVLVGDEALPTIAVRLKRWWPAALAFKLPGATAAARILYRWFADRRYWIAGLFSHVKHEGKHEA